jgi:hypothetical protein
MQSRKQHKEEISMKVTHAPTLLILFASAIAPACTNATAAGTFGFTTSGTLILPTGAAPVAAVGAITFELNGNAIGNQDRSVGGAFAHETLNGTLTVNHDCTTRLDANVLDSNGNLIRTAKIDGVLVNNGQQIRGIFESVVLPNGVSLPSVLTIDAARIRGHSN